MEPTAGMEDLLEAEAVRILAVEIDFDASSPPTSRVSWTLAVKLRDVPAVRDIALSTCPHTDVDARTEIEDSFAAAWNAAADRTRRYAAFPASPGKA